MEWWINTVKVEAGCRLAVKRRTMLGSRTSAGVVFYTRDLAMASEVVPVENIPRAKTTNGRHIFVL